VFYAELYAVFVQAFLRRNELPCKETRQVLTKMIRGMAFVFFSLVLAG
jgi:hypothetical protein